MTPKTMPEQELRELWVAGVPVHEIARRFGVAKSTVNHWRRKLQIEERPNKYRRRDVDPTPKEIEERARECLDRRSPDVYTPDRVEVRQYVFDGRDASFHPCA